MPYAEVNGLDMYYEIHGDGPPLLLLHGGCGSISELWVSYFSPTFRVIAPEQMGHGRTADVVDRAFHYHDMAEDTVALMRELRIESASIVGYSDGGIIGLDIAIHHPERVSKLVVTGSNTRADGYTPDNLEWLRTFDPHETPVTDDYARRSPHGAGYWPKLRERLRPMWLAEPNYSRDEVRGIGAPTLIIIGDDDIVTPEHAVEMFRTIPDARLCVIPRARHGVMPKETILTFLHGDARIPTPDG
jgi:pimeloyl-ACP methyl ester carboxylesterase